MREGADGRLMPSIVDPHGTHLGDASPKLKALALYADDHGASYERILAIGAETPSHELVGLNLLDSAVRKAVYECPADRDSLSALFDMHGKGP